MEITSVNNDLVKETVKLQQKKYRDETKKFILEGFKSVEEAYLSGIKFDKVFVQKEKRGKYSFLRCEFVETNEAVLKKISTTSTPPEIVAVAFQKENSYENLGNKILLLENISDAGNLGTIIRTSAAFDIDTIILYGETVDLYNPKVVRSSVGNLWKTNIVKMDKIEQLQEYFAEYKRYATLPNDKNTKLLSDIEFTDVKTLFMFGSEADGLSEKLKIFATDGIKIEMKENVESLNLSISVGIILYKIFANNKS